MTAPQLTQYVQGQGSVTADGLNTFQQTTNIIPDLRSFVGVTGIMVLCRGLAVVNDGGGGNFYWNALGTGPDDGVNTIVPTGAAVGVWSRLIASAAGIVPISPPISASGTVITNGLNFIPINNTTGAPFNISLPPPAAPGETHTIKDWLGNAGTFAITIHGNGFNIDGASDFVMNINYQAISVTFAFSKWSIF